MRVSAVTSGMSASLPARLAPALVLRVRHDLAVLEADDPRAVFGDFADRA